MNKLAPFERRLTVLRLLAKHGPLSIRSLEASIVPSITRKRLSEVLGRMKRARLISQRYENLFGNQGVYYQIAQDEPTRRRVADIVKLPENKLVRHGIRRFDLMHSENCAMWVEYLERLLPYAKIIREQQFHENEELRSVLLADTEDRDCVPDLVVVIPSEIGGDNVYIAIEIEKSPKGRDRLLKKLKRYADETRIDGLLYVCDSDDISTRLRDAYKASVLKKSIRVGHFSENFFLFSDATAAVEAKEPSVQNVELEPVNFLHWISILRRDSLFDRRDANFKGQGSCPGPKQRA